MGRNVKGRKKHEIVFQSVRSDTSPSRRPMPGHQKSAFVTSWQPLVSGDWFHGMFHGMFVY
jgi:hypothetical protein